MKSTAKQRPVDVLCLTIEYPCFPLQNLDFYNLWMRITWPSSRGSVLFPIFDLVDDTHKSFWKEIFFLSGQILSHHLQHPQKNKAFCIQVYAVILPRFKLLLAPTINYPAAKKNCLHADFFSVCWLIHYPECLACSLVLSMLHLLRSACCAELLALAGTHCLCQKFSLS